MKKNIIAIGLSAIIAFGACTTTDKNKETDMDKTNPFFSKYETPFGVQIGRAHV